MKNPDYPDTLYVTDLVVADTVNTMPEKTLEAFADHGEVEGDQVTGRAGEAQQVFDALAAVGHRLRRRAGRARERRASRSSRSPGTSSSRPSRARWSWPRRDAGTRPPASSYDLAFGYADEAAYASRRRVAGRRRGREPDRAPGRHPVGAGRRGGGRQAAGVGSLSQTSRGLVDDVAALRVQLREQGLSHVVLCGMGGSSLAPEVICEAAGVELTVLDSSDPDFVRSALEDRLDETVVVVSSKSGGTVETDSQRRAYEKAFRDAGIDPAGADRGRHRPRVAAGGVGPRRRLPGVPGRPRRGRPLLRAHRVRPGAERAGRRGHLPAAGRGRGDPARAGGRHRRQPRPAAGRPVGVPRTGPASTSWCWRTPGRRTPASGTGRSS